MSHWSAQPQRPLPKLTPPLAQRWSVSPQIDAINLSPVGYGDAADAVTVVAAADVAAIAVADGRVRWRYRGPGHVLALTATHAGPVSVHFDGRQAHLVALDWDGARLWQTAMDLGMGGHSVRGLGDHLLAQGVPLTPEGGPVCRLIAAETGRVEAEYPVDGDLPHVVPRGLVFGYVADDPAESSLDLLLLPDLRRLRLLRFLHDTRTVVGEVVVVSRFEIDGEPGQLAAVDTTTEETLWMAMGGPNLTVPADATHVASVATDGGSHLTAILRELRTGQVVWQSAPVSGATAMLLLAADTVLAFVDGQWLYVFDRTTGALLQTLDEPSSLVYGAYLAACGVVDVCGDEVRLLAGSAA